MNTMFENALFYLIAGFASAVVVNFVHRTYQKKNTKETKAVSLGSHGAIPKLDGEKEELMDDKGEDSLTNEVGDKGYLDPVHNGSNELSTDALEKENILPEVQPKKHFYAEAFVTSGPRKESRLGEEELGEDTCGFLQMGDKLLFWILDGESQREKIEIAEDNTEIFSSRLMAQALSSFFPDVFNENPTATPREILQRSMSRLCDEWKKKVKPYKKDHFQEPTQCCTTIILGVLDISGKLLIERIGDSKAIIFDQDFDLEQSDLSFKPKDENNKGQFFSAQLTDSGQLKLYTDEGPVEGQAVEGESFDFDAIDTVICFSDGVSNAMADKLEKLVKATTKEIRDVIFQLPQTFQDDKSLLLLRIIDY